VRILFVVERPTQFEAPFFRFAAADPEHDFEVLFTRPAPGSAVHDPELGRTVEWGIDLTAGYPWTAPGSIEMGTWRRALWVAREVRRRRPDLAIVNGYTQAEYVAAAIGARLAGVEAALRTDSVLFPGEGRPRLLKRLVMAVPLGSLFRLFLTTGTLGRRYLETCGVPDERIGLFSYAVDVDRFRQGARPIRSDTQERARVRSRLGVPRNARVILALTKLSPREAPWDLLRAFFDLPGDDLRLVVAGDGPERAALEELAARNDPGRVRFSGYVPYPELPALYGAVDLFVHPAAEERWGVSVAEALAAGLPAVTSDRVGAGHDLIRPGENGFLYRTGDHRDLATALERALALDPAAVEAADRAILARWDYRATWQEILSAAARVAPADPTERNRPGPTDDR